MEDLCCPFYSHGLFISKGPIIDRLEEDFSEFEKEVLCTQRTQLNSNQKPMKETHILDMS